MSIYLWRLRYGVYYDSNCVWRANTDFLAFSIDNYDLIIPSSIDVELLWLRINSDLALTSLLVY